MPQLLPQSVAKELGPQRATLIKKIIEGNTVQDSARFAGYSPSSAQSYAHTILKNPKVSAALDRVGLTDEALARMIKQNVKAGQGVKATADTSLRGIELAYRLKGYLDRPSETNNLSQTNIVINQLKAMDDSQLQEKLDTLLNEVEALKK